MAYTGTGASLQIGKESTWGTAVSGTNDINITSESLKLNLTKTVEDTLIARVAPSARLLMSAEAGGSVSGILKPEFAGRLLQLALGGTDTVAANSPVTGAYTHSIVACSASGTLPSFTAIVDRRVSVKKYSGCKIASFTLDAAAGDYVKYTLDIKAKDESAGTLATLPAFSLKSFKAVGASITLGGTSVPAKSVKVTVNNSLQDTGQTYTTGLYKGEPLHGTREITVDVELNYETVVDTIDSTNYQTDTPLATVVLTLVSPSMVVGSTPYTVTVTLANVAVTGVERNVSGQTVIPAKISGQATSVSSTEPITVQVIDATATAYSA